MDELNVQEMKPGLLVVGSVSLVGGIHYNREEEQSWFDDKAQFRKWNTTSRIDDVDERNEALKIREKIYGKIRSQCVNTLIGPICHKDKKDDLLVMLSEIQQEEETFNSTAKTCRLISNYGIFEVKGDNYPTIAAIMRQIAEVANSVDRIIQQDDEVTLSSTPRKWLKGMNPSAILLLPDNERDAIIARARAELIRKAIKDIKGVETLLPPDASAATKDIVNKSRKIARDLCTRVERRQQSLNEVLEEVDLSGIRKNRAAFVVAAASARKRALTPEETISMIEPRKLL